MVKKKIIVDSEFWELFPAGQINVLLLNDINNNVDPSKNMYFEKLLKNGKNEGKKFLIEDTFSDNLVVQEWRNAYKKFKTKKGARSSIEALLKRVSQDRDFTLINPLVDVYNSISMKYAVPLGGEDLEHIDGNIHLGKAKGGESFFPLGAENDSPALEGEICYFDSTGAVCRCLNWREAKRTMLLENTQNAILISESINLRQAKQSELAIDELKELVDEYFKIDSKIYKLTKDNSIATIIY